MNRILRWLSLSLLLAAAWPAQAQIQFGGWRECAREGQYCDVGSRGVVRYGAEGQWSSRVLSGRVACTNDLFGDPAPAMPKRCEVRDYTINLDRGGAWAFCAGEGETCYLRGSGDVRFGTDRSFAVRRASGSVRCDVESFGDPVPGQTKHCEVRADNLASAPANDRWGGWEQAVDNNRWRQCAVEGQPCNVRGRAEVRFGDGNRFAARTVDGSVLCATAVFGDPAPGVVKHCEVRAGGFAGFGNNNPADGGWRQCSEEGGYCNTGSGRSQVRFGLPGRYVYRDAYGGGVNCDTVAFGADPVPGQRKQCDVRR